MRYATSFRLAACQMVLAGFLPLLLTGRLGIVQGLIFLAYLVFVMASPRFTHPPKSRESVWRTLLGSLLILSLYLADTAVLSRDFIMALAHVTMVIVALKLARPRRARDLLYVAALSLGFLLLSSLYTFDLWFLLFAAWFFVAGVQTLMLLEIRAASARFRPEAGEGETPLSEVPVLSDLEIPVRSRRLVLLSLATFVAVVALAVPLFLGLPRLAFGVLQWDLLRDNAQSGFTETTRLGEAASIRQSEAVVMRVRTELPPEQLPPDLKWRGIALDRFDGWNWSSWRKPVLVSNVRPGEFHRVADTRRREKLLRQEFYLEPMGTQTVFLAFRPHSVSWEVGPIVFNSDVIRTLRVNPDKFRYTAISDIRRPTPAELEATPPVDTEQFYLPSTLEIRNYSFRIAELADRVTRDAPSPWAKAQALTRFLRDNYRYSLEMSPCPPGRRPVEFFLFDMRMGHCEYFASTLALMLRYEGIPSRLVNGFQAGEVNPINNTFIVRQKDAHSWVEAWFHGVGWVELDPTPSVPFRVRSGFLAFFENLLEYVHFLWISQIVNYDLADQTQVFAWVRSNFRSAGEWLKSVFKGVEKFFTALWGLVTPGADAEAPAWFLPLVLAPVAAAAGVLLFRLLRRVARAFGGRKARVHLLALRVRERFFRACARAGYRRARGETFREFLGRIRLAESCPAGFLEAFGEGYHRLRFDPSCDEEELSRRLEALLPRLSAALVKCRGERPADR
ncbi:MAG: DUF3488 domain-containing protein [Acidobacteria bacterium]|nr:DUF3488 domain-containing protein [Acidobacteriota bacterium]